MIRVVLPAHLRSLTDISGEVQVEVEGQVTQRSVLNALEARYPKLQGTIRDHVTQQRRPFMRFFACSSAGRSCASSRARRIGRMSRRMRLCPKRWRPVRSLF